MRSNPKTDNPTSPETSGIARRTLLGAAWSAPVIVAAVAAPLASASTPSQLILNINTLGLYNSGKDFQVRAQAPYVNYTITTTIVSITMLVTFPKNAFTGAYTFTEDLGDGGQGTWTSPNPAVDKGTYWQATFIWTGVLQQNSSQATHVLKVVPVTVTPWPGATVTIAPVPKDSLGHTPVVTGPTSVTG